MSLDGIRVKSHLIGKNKSQQWHYKNEPYLKGKDYWSYFILITLKYIFLYTSRM